MRALCEKFDLPYTTGSLFKQYLLALRTIHKLALPDKWLTATSDNAPETSSELPVPRLGIPGRSHGDGRGTFVPIRSPVSVSVC